jgi:ribosomal-protein-alanine N-acetyltransferase
VTEAIYLRPLMREDINDNYLAWFRDEEVTSFLEARNITREDAIAHLEAGKINNSYIIYAIVYGETGKHIGNLKLGPIDHKHRVSDLVCVIGDREYWRRGLAEQAIREGNRIAFEEFDLRKLSGGVIEGNIGSLKTYARAGWVEEGRQKGHYLVEGNPRDRILISCFNPCYFSDRVD